MQRCVLTSPVETVHVARPADMLMLARTLAVADKEGGARMYSRAVVAWRLGAISLDHLRRHRTVLCTIAALQPDGDGAAIAVVFAAHSW